MLSIQALRAVALAAFLEYVYLTEGASLPPLHWSTIESSSLDAELATSIPLDARSTDLSSSEAPRLLPPSDAYIALLMATEYATDMVMTDFRAKVLPHSQHFPNGPRWHYGHVEVVINPGTDMLWQDVPLAATVLMRQHLQSQLWYEQDFNYLNSEERVVGKGRIQYYSGPQDLINDLPLLLSVENSTTISKRDTTSQPPLTERPTDPSMFSIAGLTSQVKFFDFGRKLAQLEICLILTKAATEIIDDVVRNHGDGLVLDAKTWQEGHVYFGVYPEDFPLPNKFRYSDFSGFIRIITAFYIKWEYFACNMDFMDGYRGLCATALFRYL